MRLGTLPLVILTGVLSASCGDSELCVAPEGCVRASTASGSCRCDEWQTVSVEALPIKFVVVSVEYAPPGNASELVYGYSEGANMPPAFSDLGSRVRALVRSWDGTDAVVDVGTIDEVAGYGIMLPVTRSSATMWLAGGDGQGSGSAWGWRSFGDVPSHGKDAISVWVNPTVTVTTDFVGQRKVNWGWTAVGGCFWPLELGCMGPMVHRMYVEQIDGTVAPGDVYTAQFLATLTTTEREAIVKYDPFFDPAGRDPAFLATDPRFELLGSATVAPDAVSAPTTTWTPCTGVLTDASFAPLAETELHFAWSSLKLVLQHGVLSHQATCVPQQPGLVMGTTTPGCEISSMVYVDRAFGTLVFAPVTATSSCTAW